MIEATVASTKEIAIEPFLLLEMTTVRGLDHEVL
jgi:hypothetical protein